MSVAVCQRGITPIISALTDDYEARFGETGPANHTNPIYMAGFGTNRRATDKNDRLRVIALIIQGLGCRIEIVTLGLIGYFHNHSGIVREMAGADID